MRRRGDRRTARYFARSVVEHEARYDAHATRHDALQRTVALRSMYAAQNTSILSRRGGLIATMLRQRGAAGRAARVLMPAAEARRRRCARRMPCRCYADVLMMPAGGY
jgi:hypothetical protein